MPEVGSLKASHHPQRCRLPAPGGSQERDKLARCHLQVERVNGHNAAKLLTHAFQAQKSAVHSCFLSLDMYAITPIAAQVMAKATIAIAEGSYTLLRVRLAM